MQVLAGAHEIDQRASSGQNVRPLCGLTIAVKDNIDVAGYPTEAGTPSLQGDLHARTLYSCQHITARNLHMIDSLP